MKIPNSLGYSSILMNDCKVWFTPCACQGYTTGEVGSEWSKVFKNTQKSKFAQKSFKKKIKFWFKKKVRYCSKVIGV